MKNVIKMHRVTMVEKFKPVGKQESKEIRSKIYLLIALLLILALFFILCGLSILLYYLVTLSNEINSLFK
jgi:hypothetical protein